MLQPPITSGAARGRPPPTEAEVTATSERAQAAAVRCQAMFHRWERMPAARLRALTLTGAGWDCRSRKSTSRPSNRIMGDGWVSAATFRFGSSSLLATALAALDEPEEAQA